MKKYYALIIFVILLTTTIQILDEPPVMENRMWGYYVDYCKNGWEEITKYNSTHNYVIPHKNCNI